MGLGFPPFSNESVETKTTGSWKFEVSFIHVNYLHEVRNNCFPLSIVGFIKHSKLYGGIFFFNVNQIILNPKLAISEIILLRRLTFTT